MHSGSLYCLNAAVAALLVFAALRDIATRLVPNWVSIAILACGIILHTVIGNPFTAIGWGLLVFFTAALMWRRGWLGGADVKLLGAASVAVAPANVGSLIIAISLAGGVLAVLYIALSRLLHRPLAGPRTGFLPRLLKAEVWRIHRRGPLPYAVAIAAGGLFTLFPS
nr:prepilin peptidase [uncultured Rhodopila sp.]